MSDSTPRLRMFAGPNGSGKSTLKRYLRPDLIGIYLNPDEIESEVRERGTLGLSAFDVAPSAEEILPYLTESSFLASAGLGTLSRQIGFDPSTNRLDFLKSGMNSYFASVVADFLRKSLISTGKTFTFETVMSHRSKLEILDKARRSGYRTYLYYVATDDPAINVSRVHSRMKSGGHSVPDDLIVSRYRRSINLLFDAIKLTNRAYVFDNSSEGVGQKQLWLAEFTDGKVVELKTELVPEWFGRSVLDRFKR